MCDNTLILFDYGGVVALNNRDEASQTMCEIFNVDRVKLRAILEEKSVLGQAFRKGEILEEEFWNGISTNLDIDREQLPDDAVLSRLWAERYEIDRSVLKYVAELRKNNLVGILTNIDSARDRYLIEELKLTEHFDVHYASWRFRQTKQAIELWKLVDWEAKHSFPKLSRVIYIDDRSEHVVSAQSVGWHGIHYKGLEELQNEMLELGIVHDERSLNVDKGGR